MKTMKLLGLLAVILLASCGNDEPEPTGPSSPAGTITFTINSNGGVGTATSPAKVEKGDTLNMAISQTSSYTDPNGSVFTCKPEAVIKVSTSGDPLYVKDFKTLANVKESSSVASETSLGEKLTKKTLQTFNVGGKEVVFDLAYDIFNHINSQKQSIEMPYIKVNSANYGTAKAEETRASNAPVAVMTGMRITPHRPQTRGVIVDSTTYDVNVAFNLEIESVNAKEPQSQTLSFDVEFQAVVESTTEYPDPEMQFSHQLQVLGGTNSTASPFVLNPGETMQLQWVGNSQYSYFSLQDFSSQTIQYESKANATLSASNDTLWVTNKEELEQIVASEAIITRNGTSPQVTTGQKTFSLAGKDISFNWSYDIYGTVNAEGTEVAMPYLELSEPQIISVNVTELPDAIIPGKQAKIYEVEMRLSQELKSVNAPEEQSETIEYVVKCIGATEVKLVKVVYRKDWEWVDSHDNILLAYYAMVHRDRIYSTGETFTDTFRDAGHFASIRNDVLFGGEPEADVSDGKVIRREYDEQDYDSIIYSSFTAIVPNISRVVNLCDPTVDPDNQPVSEYFSAPPGTWEEYVTSKRYTNLDILLDGVEVVGTDSISTKPSGWYFFSPDYCYEGDNLIYGDGEIRLLCGEFRISFYDTFLVIDGQMINFLEFRGPMSFETHKEDITMPNNAPGIVYTSEFRRRFLGKNFYACHIDSVYQPTP